MMNRKNRATGFQIEREKRSGWILLPRPFRKRGYSVEEVRTAAENHEQERIEQASKQEGSNAQSDYLGSMVYGGLDGIITTFAVVSGVIGAQLSPGIILILGFANLLGDGFSMATGAYLSSKSEMEVYARERKRTAEQISANPEVEQKKLYEIYRQQGYPEPDARQLVEIKCRDPGRWVSTLIAEKLLLLPQKQAPIKKALATFFAFILAGAIPLLIFLLDLIFNFGLPTITAFIISMVLSGLALLGLGAAKVFVTYRNPWRSALEMLVVGALAGLVAFGVGLLLKSLAVDSV